MQKWRQTAAGEMHARDTYLHFAVHIMLLRVGCTTSSFTEHSIFRLTTGRKVFSGDTRDFRYPACSPALLCDYINHHWLRPYLIFANYFNRPSAGHLSIASGLPAGASLQIGEIVRTRKVTFSSNCNFLKQPFFVSWEKLRAKVLRRIFVFYQIFTKFRVFRCNCERRKTVENPSSSNRRSNK